MAGTVSVTLACGCVIRDWGGADPPYCETHTEHRVQRVSAPPPRFTSYDCKAEGPYVRQG